MLYRIDSTGKRVAMTTEKERKPGQDPADARAHITNAHQILKALQEKIGPHPEIGAAITKLEMALNVLAVNTSAIL
jgi:hypothetical protein